MIVNIITSSVTGLATFLLTFFFYTPAVLFGVQFFTVVLNAVFYPLRFYLEGGLLLAYNILAVYLPAIISVTGILVSLLYLIFIMFALPSLFSFGFLLMIMLYYVNEVVRVGTFYLYQLTLL